MPGVNRYSREVAKSVNVSERAGEIDPCVFISYKGEDRVAAAKIAGYIMSSGVDVYFDALDTNLAFANLSGHHQRVVDFIGLASRARTHILAVISQRTKVLVGRFEIGSARRKRMPVAYVALEDVWNTLPSYLQTQQLTLR